ncbi:MAG: hypothetical protein AAGM67_07355, partial [Bacteroidota bacterium]
PLKTSEEGLSPVVDASLLEEVVRETVASELDDFQDRLIEEIRMMMSRMPQHPSPGRVLSSPTSPLPQRVQILTEAEETTFIPSNLVPEKSDAVIETKDESSSGQGVGNALAALKKLKNK